MSFDATYPFPLPNLPPLLDFKDDNLIDLLLKARTQLGELKGYAFAMPNPLLLLSPAIIRESVASSNIENIYTTVERVLQQQLFPEVQQREPDKEVLHYRNAIMWGYNQMNKIPVSSRLILDIHEKLLPLKSHGYRTTQNTIQNSLTGEVIFTPPPANKITELISNWEKFIHNQIEGVERIDPLVKCAIAHYQFEAIHPFIDGNGRTGRILMVLYLIHEELLNLPILYISSYINKNRDEYYQLLLQVSKDGNWNEFILFIVRGIYLQARSTKETLFKIMELYHEYKEKIKIEHKKIYFTGLVDHLFASPIVTPVNLGEQIGVHYTTASRYLKELAEAGLLEDIFHGKYHFFVNQKLMKIISD